MLERIYIFHSNFLEVLVGLHVCPDVCDPDSLFCLSRIEMFTEFL